MDLAGAKYYPEKETYFVFDLTDSVAAYLREAQYRVMDHWIHNSLDLVAAKYDPEKETYFVLDLTESIAAYQREKHYRVETYFVLSPTL